MEAILFIKSNLHLVADIQNCIKILESADYTKKVKLINLKEMAKTIAYIQEQMYDKGWFRKEQYAEIALYESARKFLLEHSVDGNLPLLNLLKTEKAKLPEAKKSASESYCQCKDYQKTCILSAPM